MLNTLRWATAIVGMVVAVDPVYADMSVRERLADGQEPVIGSWRVTGGGYPESTLAGIQHSLDIGAEIIDLHVQLTGDGEHIVFHHARLDHSTNVNTVFPNGPPGGPTREERGGLDYTRDYTLQEVRKLRLTIDGKATVHPIPTLQEALDLVDGKVLAVLNLQEFDLEKLAAELAQRSKSNVLAYSINPEVLLEVLNTTGVAGYASISQSRLFESETPIEILEAARGILGDDLVLAHVKRKRLLTPDLLARAKEMGIGLSVAGFGREDLALGDKNDVSVWLETLDSDAIVYWTTKPDELLQALKDQ